MHPKKDKQHLIVNKRMNREFLLRISTVSTIEVTQRTDLECVLPNNKIYQASIANALAIASDLKNFFPLAKLIVREI